MVPLTVSVSTTGEGGGGGEAGGRGGEDGGGGGAGDNGDGDGAGGGGGDGTLSPAPAVVMVGSDCTVIPSTAEAAAAVPRAEESDDCTAVAVVEAGTEMVAMMITLAAATRIVTSDLSTPAAVATACCRLEVSE